MQTPYEILPHRNNRRHCMVHLVFSVFENININITRYNSTMASYMLKNGMHATAMDVRIKEPLVTQKKRQFPLHRELIVLVTTHIAKTHKNSKLLKNELTPIVNLRMNENV